MRALLILLTACAGFAVGIVVRDSIEAQASGVGGGSVNLSSYSGNVGISGNLGVTGTVGITGTAGTTGLRVVGQGSGHAIHAIGGASNGGGIIAYGTAQGSGVLGYGGVTSAGGYGGYFTGGGTQGPGVHGIGSGSGAGISGISSTATGQGVLAANSSTGNALSVTSWESHTNGSATAGTTQTQAGATVLTATYTRVTTGNANDGVALPTGSVARCVVIANISAVALRVYGNNSDNDTINGGAADAHVTQSASKDAWFCTSDGVAWITGNL